MTVSAVLCVLVVAAAAAQEAIEDHTDDIADSSDYGAMEKRKSGMSVVPFPCNGYDFLPRCLHGGRGPRKTFTKSGNFCVCLCKAQWQGPECSYAPESLGKRTYPWKIMSMGEEEKRSTPWKILGMGGGKRVAPWEVMAQGGAKATARK